MKIPHDQIIAAYCRAVKTSGPLQTKCLKSYGIPVGQVGFSTNHLLASQIMSNSSDNQEYFGYLLFDEISQWGNDFPAEFCSNISLYFDQDE